MSIVNNYAKPSLVSICGLVAICGFIASQRVLTDRREQANNLTAGQVSSTGHRPAQARALEAFGRLPLSFEVNRGQIDARVKYLARGSGYGLFLSASEAVLQLRKPDTGKPNETKRRATNPQSAVVRMKLSGANPTPQIEGLDELPGKSNYFIGADPRQWRAGIQNFARVRYREVYPGIDLVYYGNQRQLEYDLVVAPGAAPGRIKLAFAGVKRMRIDANGDLVLGAADGELRQHKPRIYQDVDGARREIAGAYVIAGKREVGFQIGDYDATRPLIIDPILSYSTYLGGSSSDSASDIAVDATGAIYILGQTQSSNFPTTTGAFQPNFVGATCRFLGFTFPCRDVFVTKPNPAGTALVYSTYLGGGGEDAGAGIAVDTAGRVYVTGYTVSTNFPTSAGAYQRTFRGGGSEFSDYGDVFVTALNAAGSALVFSTYLGGGSDDGTGDIAVDAAGNVYVAGFTESANFPTTPGALKNIREGFTDGFVTKLNPTGSALIYSTFLGGSGSDGAGGLAVDAAGHAYVTGSTSSTNFPTVNPVQAALNGDNDAFVTKLNPAGNGLIYSTYLGGSGRSSEDGSDLALDGAGNAYVIGYTGVTDFPTANPLQAMNKGGFGAFVAKLNAEGSTLAYSTYLGGNDNEFGYGIAVDAAGNAHVTGETKSSDFPTASPIQATNGGRTDAFVAKINFAGSAFAYSTYLGGSLEDYGYGIALDTAGNAYVAGSTLSSNFPTASPLRGNNSGSGDAFIAKIMDDPPPPNDLGVAAIGGANVVAIGSSVMVGVTVTNFGTAAQSNFPASYRINDGPEVMEMITETLAPGASLNKTFGAPWMPPSLGNFTIAARTRLTGDQRSANDSFSKALRVTVANDLGVAGFVELPVRVGIGGSATIKVRVTNFGANPQSNFPVSYQINDGAPVTEGFSGTLAPLQTAVKTFAAPFTPPEPGAYRITARTNLAGDENAANDAAQTTLPAIRAQYRGSWQGTTGQSLPIRFTVDERDFVTSVEMDYRVSNPALGTCVYRIGGSSGVINNGQFEITLGGGGLGFIVGAEPKLRGTFSSPTACAGTVSQSSVGFAVCGNNTVISTGISVSSMTFSAQRQVLCPTVSSVSPASSTVGATVTIAGTNLADVSAVKFANNVTASFTIVSDTQISARVPAGAANGPITLSKAGCTDVQTGAFTVQPAAEPTLASLNPSSAIAGGAAFTLTVTGANFINGSIVRWNGSDRPTNFVSITQLTAAIPASDIASAGTANITVLTPPPGGGATSARPFLITSRVSSVSAASFIGAELAAESIVAAFGVGLATRIETAPGGQPLPTELAGTRVEVRDSAGMMRLAPLFFVAPQQINYLMPPMTAAGAATITITIGDGKVASGPTQIAAVAPSLFAANANGQGVAAAVVLRRKADGTDSFEPVAQFDSAQNRFIAKPIDLGPEQDQVFLILYGTGFRNRSALSAVTVAIGGLNSEVLLPVKHLDWPVSINAMCVCRAAWPGAATRMSC